MSEAVKEGEKKKVCCQKKDSTKLIKISDVFDFEPNLIAFKIDSHLIDYENSYPFMAILTRDVKESRVKSWVTSRMGSKQSEKN